MTGNPSGGTFCVPSPVEILSVTAVEGTEALSKEEKVLYNF